MVKIFYKILSVSLVFIIALSCVGAFATDDVQIPAYLSADNMTNEASFAITKDLDLSKINESALANGNTVTWASSDSAISINGNTAIVTRAKTDKSVTLTATVNTTPKTVKEFNFTVKGTDSFVAFSDTFNYPDYVGNNVNQTPVSSYLKRNVSDSCADKVSTTLTDNGSLELKVTDKLVASSGYCVYFDKKQEKVNFNMTISSNVEGGTYTPGSRALSFIMRGTSERHIFEARIGYSEDYFSVTSTNKDKTLVHLKNCYIPFGESYDLGFEVDVNEGTYSIFINGESVTDKPIIFQTPDTENPAVKLSYMEILATVGDVAFTSEFSQVSFSYPVPKLVFSSPLFKKVEENIEKLVNSITKGTYKSELSARNLTSSSKKVAFVTAVYSDNGKKLKDVKIDEKQIYSGRNANFTTTIDVNDGEIFKCFLIEGFNTMKPLELPAGTVFNLSSRLSYDNTANKKAHMLLTWDAPISFEDELVGYKIMRDQLEVGYVSASQTEYKDYDADFFSENLYEVRPVMKSGASPKGVFTTSQAVREVELLPTTVVDSTTGRTWHYINFFGKNAIRDYYTTRNWNNNKFYFTDDEYRIFEYDINTNIVKYLDDRYKDTVDPSRALMTIGKNTKSLYYVDNNMEVVRMNLSTYEKEIIADMPDSQVNRCSFISVNDSETKLILTVNFEGTNPQNIIPVLDIETGKWNTTFNVPAVSQDGKTGLGMPIINPIKDDLVLVNNIIASDETGLIAAPRLWLLDKGTDAIAPLYNERKTFTAENAAIRGANGELNYVEGRPFFGENIGHENWTMDGEKVVVVKYQSPIAQFRIGPHGISEVSLNGKMRVINEHLGGNHVSTSPALARWIVYDGSGERTVNGDGVERKTTHVSVLDSTTGQHYKIADVVCNMPHPGHVHPSFSYDGNYVWFGFETDDEAKTIQIGWADVSDIVSKPVVGGREKLTDIAEFYNYEGTVNSAEKETVDGVECYKISPDHQMLIDIDDSLYYGAISPEHTNDKSYKVTVKMKYLDNGTDDAFLRMFYWNDTAAYSDYYDKTRYEHNADLYRDNTGNWIEKEIVYEKANLENINLMNTDLRIKNSASGEDLYLKDISITVEETS